VLALINDLKGENVAKTKKEAGKSIRKAVSKKKVKFPPAEFNPFPYCVEIEHSASSPGLPHTLYPTLSPTGDIHPKSVYFMYEMQGCTGVITLPGGYFRGHPKEFILKVSKRTGRTKIVTLNPKGAGVLSGNPIMWKHTPNIVITVPADGTVIVPPGGGGIIIHYSGPFNL
jgi:hypothetical protein